MIKRRKGTQGQRMAKEKRRGIKAKGHKVANSRRRSKQDGLLI